jgi:Uma2 family endonuclease
MITMANISIDKAKIKTRPSDGKVFFTVDDLDKFAEWPEGPLIELINGELYVVPSPTIKHQDINLEIAHQIKSYLENHNLGRIFIAPVDLILSEEDLTIPDVVFVKKSNEDIIKEKNIRGRPDLVMEIVSSNKKQDYVKKKEVYEKFKIPEYWIIDPSEEVVLVFYLDSSSKYSDPKKYKITDKIEVKAISDLFINLENLFL